MPKNSRTHMCESVCPLCGCSTQTNAQGNEYCLCGWYVDEAGNEGYDPDDNLICEMEEVTNA